MNRKEKLLKICSKKHVLNILAYIYQQGLVSFKQLCKEFDFISEHTIRTITNSLSSSQVIETVKDPNSIDRRSRVFIIKDENFVISVLELEVE